MPSTQNKSTIIVARGEIPSNQFPDFQKALTESRLCFHTICAMEMVDDVAVVTLHTNDYAEFLLRRSLSDGMLRHWGNAFTLEVCPTQH